MDDKATPENPKKDFNKLDLNQLQDFNFGTQWTQDKSSPSDTQPKGKRPRGDDRGDPRRDRRGFRKPEGGANPGGGERRGGGDRRPRHDVQGGGRGEGQHGGGRPAQQFQGPYDSPYFSASFYPEDNSFDALAKTIRGSCRTIELFEIAKTVVAKEDRFIVVLARRDKDGSKDKKPFYVSVPDGMPFESEEEVVNHVMTNHLDKFFTTEEVEVDAPTGNFQVINKCGITGALLGPPNYHRYNQFVQQHVATKMKGMSIEAFRNRIESVRDPEVVTQWTEQMKKVVHFTWKTEEAAKPASSEEAASAAKEEVAPEEKPAEETPVEATAEVEVSETPVEETAPEGTPAATEEVKAEEETPASEEPAAEEAPAGLTFDTIEDARLHLLSNARQQIIRTVETVRFHGRLLESMPDSEIRRAARGALDRQRYFPLDTANGLRGRLRREHFTIFKKGSKGISYVCAVKRKFRVPGQTFADSIGELVSFIEANSMVKVSELTSKFAGIENPAAQVKEGETAPAVVVTDAQKAKFTRMQSDLRWLVMEGYVTEFIDGRLFAAPPIPEAKKKVTEEHDPENYPEKPAEAAAPVNPEPVKQSKPEQPVREESPVAETAPEEKATPMAESPVGDPAPLTETAPAVEPAPVAETAPVEEAAPASEVVEPEKKPEAPAPAASEPVVSEDKETPPQKD